MSSTALALVAVAVVCAFLVVLVAILVRMSRTSRELRLEQSERAGFREEMQTRELLKSLDREDVQLLADDRSMLCGTWEEIVGKITGRGYVVLNQQGWDTLVGTMKQQGEGMQGALQDMEKRHNKDMRRMAEAMVKKRDKEVTVHEWLSRGDEDEGGEDKPQKPPRGWPPWGPFFGGD